MIDIAIPTCKTAAEVAGLVQEIKDTAGCPCSVLATCIDASAAHNRNVALDWAHTDPLIMCDDDTQGFPWGWAVRLASVLLEHPECVMVSAQLARPDGQPGPMMGDCYVRRNGVSEARARKLPTACVAVRKNDIRFDEELIGSGFDDDCYAQELKKRYPDCTFLVCHDVWVTHLNNMLNQSGKFWDHNKAVYERKWGAWR